MHIQTRNLSTDIKLPKNLFILPLKEVVVFPSMVVSVYVKNIDFIEQIKQKKVNNELIGLVAYKNPEVKIAFHTGTACKIIEIIMGHGPDAVVLVEGVARFEITKILQEAPYIEAEVAKIEPTLIKSEDGDGLALEIKRLLETISSLGRPLPEEVIINLNNLNDYDQLCDLAGSYLSIPLKEKQYLLEMRDTLERMKEVVRQLSHEMRMLEVRSKIHSEVEKEMSKTEKEFVLRQELKAIQKELGEEGDPERAAEMKEIKHIEEEIIKAKMPAEVEKIAIEELKRLKRIYPISPEYNVTRNYIEWLYLMPWNKSSKTKIDIKKAKAILDEDHYGLKDIKERIVEYLAICQMQNKPGATIMCFVGPPGVGKSSLGHSIARSLGRKFIQMSLGGMHDEAEIRGHRRTYVGAMPGNIIQNIKRAGENNPVFMLDEIDKLGLGNFQGDPASALIEVLDPELNHSFHDHYLDVPFDLSNVLFITTANILDPIPPALLDRMEVIHLAGYTEEEKVQIAKKYLVPKQIKFNGLEKNPFTIEDNAISYIIRRYTREAGLRDLEREISKICRKVAKKMLENKGKTKVVAKKDIAELLGVEQFIEDVKAEKDAVGVATGLAWTQAGGEIIFVEATKMPGHNAVTLTGQLGEVMKESAKAALSYLRSNAKKYNLKDSVFEKIDIHIHVPEGATPKDGPSAGITIGTALVSLFTGVAVKRDVAMTGEVTLTGHVLPIGGLKEKVLAAKRSGIKTIIIPSENKKDLKDIEAHLVKGIKFIFAKTLDDVVKNALHKSK
ncbi:endopeptidase La [Candidatus Peregrinibacteria bacterium]|nr:endopeptidase La [Candidatus Peregrinibacteria bacterium]